jgi:NAD(P)-dependent dehydrogenase (short-subunit alcohol dehydrogenase family)
MATKTCLITGATSGIGLVTARELAQQGFHVVLVGRNAAKTAGVVSQIQAQTRNQEVESLLADLSSQKQIHDLARRFLDQHSRLDVLINDAGGLYLQRQQTVDGLEMTLAVNHISYFLLTNLLLHLLKATPHARIVNVASGAHRKAAIDFNDLMGERSYKGWRQYCRTKLMNLLFTYELDRRLTGTGVTVNALHPGWVFTGFGKNNGWKGRLLQMLARCFAISPQKGAETVIYLASSPQVERVTGRYFIRQQIAPSTAASYDEGAAKRLWQLSAEMTSVLVTDESP